MKERRGPLRKGQHANERTLRTTEKKPEPRRKREGHERKERTTKEKTEPQCNGRNGTTMKGQDHGRKGQEKTTKKRMMMTIVNL